MLLEGIMVSGVAKWEAVPTCSSVATSYRNNYMIDRTVRQTRSAFDIYLLPLFRCRLQYRWADKETWGLMSPTWSWKTLGLCNSKQWSKVMFSE